MRHKYSVGQDVYYDPPIRRSAASGIYKIIRQLRSRMTAAFIASRVRRNRSSELLTRSSLQALTESVATVFSMTRVELLRFVR